MLAVGTQEEAELLLFVCGTLLSQQPRVTFSRDEICTRILKNGYSFSVAQLYVLHGLIVCMGSIFIIYIGHIIFCGIGNLSELHFIVLLFSKCDICKEVTYFTFKALQKK